MRNRLVSFLSIALFLAAVFAVAAPIDYAQVQRNLHRAGTDDQRRAELKALHATLLPYTRSYDMGTGTEEKNLDNQVVAAMNADDALNSEYKKVERMVDLRAFANSGPVSSNAPATVEKIKSSPLYSDPGAKGESNWISNAFEKFRNLFKFHLPDDKPADTGRGPSMAFGGLTYLVWAVLIGAVLFFVGFTVTRIRWQRRLKRQAKAILEEDEPERSLDEWLAMADSLVREGRYREAVRCLYLACLLRFDEAGVARFDRGQTNWEHLYRIHASPRLPVGLDFMPMTRAFDRIWYGMTTKGLEDVELFKGWYSDISARLQKKEAA